MKSLKLLPLLLVFATLANLQATSLTYNGGDSGVWTNGGVVGGWLDGGTGTNWNNTTPDAATFGGALPTTVNVEGGVIVGNVTVSSGAYTIAGTTGTLTLSNTTWDVASGLTNTVSTALAGTTGLIKSGGGVLLFSGANKNFSGGVTINGGAIQITNVLAGNLGSAANTAITLNGGALYTLFSANTTVNYAITVTNSGELRSLGASANKVILGSNKLNGSGTLTLTFASTNNGRFDMASAGTSQTNFSGKWVVDGLGGLLDVYAEQNLGTGSGDDFLTLKTGSKVLFRTVTFSKGITIGAGGGQIANAGSGSTTVISGKISGDATNALIFDLGNSATSSMTISSTNNSWLGSTTLSNTGVLKLGTNGVIADTGGNLQFATATSVLDLNGFSEAIGGLSGTTGIVDNRAASTASVLTVGGNNGTSTFSGVMSNSGSGATLALVKTGTGNLTLSASNSFSGGTTVRAGRLIVANANALGSGDVLVQSVSSDQAILALTNVTVAGKTVVLDSTSSRAVLLGAVGSSTWNGTITLAGGGLTQTNVEFTSEGTLTVSGVVNGAITNTGRSLTLRGAGVTNVLSAAVSIGSTAVVKTDAANTWRITSSGNAWGTTTISAGTLQVGANDALPDASNLTMAASTKLDLLSAYSDSVGTLTLTGNATIDFGLTTGTGQTLAFSNSSAISWSTFTLTINGYESVSDTLRFGTSSAGLSAGQLAAINFTGYGSGAVIDSNGYVSPVPEPSTYAMLALAGLGFGAHVLRRRRRS